MCIYKILELDQLVRNQSSWKNGILFIHTPGDSPHNSYKNMHVFLYTVYTKRVIFQF